MKPEYVDRDGETVYRPPYLQKDTFLTGWLLKSSKPALQKLLDHDLNNPAGGAVDYRPLTSAVLMSLANIQEVSSLDPRDRKKGWIDEVDICFWVLAGAFKEERGRKELDHLVWYVPYIWVTNGYTMATGREAFGYPKAYGWANLPRNPQDPGPLWADGLVIPHFSPRTEVTRQRIFTISRDPDDSESLVEWAAASKVDAFRGIAKLFHDFGDIECDLDFIFNTFKDLLGGHLPMVFLKQFRDAVQPTRACYQAIIEANATITDFRGAGLLPRNWTLQLHQYASHRIIDTLALNPAPHTVNNGFWVDFSFSMDLGQEIWRAP
jgi:hypothetical protein